MIPDDKIVGGVEVAPNSLPFQVSMQRRGILPNSAVMIIQIYFILFTI
jgi:trypsin